MERKSYKTKSKELILTYLKENSFRTVSVSDIYSWLKQKGATTNLTTVYRYLEQLEEKKILVKHATENTKKACYRYIGNDSECDEHLHVQCSKCGKIIHLDCSLMKEFQEHIQKKHGITLDCSSSLLYGICDECRSNKK